ncbi:hypothetical protein COLO4_19173 [Corchorus olitorius]|uniref:DUF3741 domain-containing protein n=1 Tax=Corchorus olitorius TaxID=93759 RepID=A0A1R3J6D9_9ROSI|nr:hypothetical protein COLO4_19173 [Corchorus olitorius]
MCTPKSATAGCLAGILRRILCSHSLPTHPSDHITESSSVASNYKKKEFSSVDKIDGSKVSPGIVARLMGLDSLPEISLLKTQVNPNSITRSRSMNSADYKQENDPIHGNKHRRVNSTLSFRDMPTYFELENEEFFVLSFEKESERKEVKSKGRKSRGSNGELKKRNEEKHKDKENRVAEKVKQQESSRRVLNVLNEEKLNRRIVDKPNHEVAKCSGVNDLSLEAKPIVSAIKSVECSKFVDKKGAPDGAKLRKKKKKIQHCVVQNAEHECSSEEDSSPVSVLDFDQFIIDHDVPTSGEDLKVEGSNSRRKLSPELESYGCKSPANDGNCLIEDDPRVKDDIEGQNLESRNKVCHSEVNLECWDPICRMIEAEVAKSSWLCSNNEEFEDITANFESNILDQLLDELVLQLLGPTP